jgi:hypothetical protein
MQLDEAELICRMAEAFGQTRRPKGMSATEAVNAMSDEMREDWLRVSEVVQRYWFEQAEQAVTIQ